MLEQQVRAEKNEEKAQQKYEENEAEMDEMSKIYSRNPQTLQTKSRIKSQTITLSPLKTNTFRQVDDEEQNDFLTIRIPDEKDKLIKKMQLRNGELRKQIQSVDKAKQRLSQRHAQQNAKGWNQIRFAFSTQESLNKQLYNARVKINMYKQQIVRLKRKDQSSLRKRIGSLKTKYEQKQQYRKQSEHSLDKMKKGNQKAETMIVDLKSGAHQIYMNRLVTQVRVLKQKEKQLQSYESQRQKRAEKQLRYITTLMKQLFDNGMPKEKIDELRNKFMNDKPQIKKQKKEENIQKQETKQITKAQMKQECRKMQHQIAVIKKSIKDQEKTLQELICQEKHAAQKLGNTQSLLQQLDKEMSQVQQKILSARGQINPVNLKPKSSPHKEASIQSQKKDKKEFLKEVRKKFSQRKTKTYLKSLENSNQNMTQFYQSLKLEQEQTKLLQPEQHHSQISYPQSIVPYDKIEEASERENPTARSFPSQDYFQIYGKEDEKGVSFKDSQIYQKIGEQTCKLTGLTIILSQSCYIVGIQAQYNYVLEGNMHQYPKQSVQEVYFITQNDKNSIPNPIQTAKEKLTCSQNQYITQISGIFSEEGILIQLRVTTNLNREHTMGNKQTDLNLSHRSQFQIPKNEGRIVYIIGCVNAKGICQLGAKIKKGKNLLLSGREIKEKTQQQTN